MFNWFSQYIFPNVPNDPKANVPNDPKPSTPNDQKPIIETTPIDISKIPNIEEARKIALEKFNQKHAETHKKNFEDCKQLLVSDSFIALDEGYGKICNIFMNEKDLEFIEKTMKSKGYKVIKHFPDSNKIYIGKS